MTKEDSQFITTVLDYYTKHGRSHLPWRKTQQPYRIAVSEIMLQQTQVDRVIPKYQAFIKQFPTARRLAAASLADVLAAWQGLGYNRRAKLLKQCAEQLTDERSGRWPKTYEELQTLPGIGPYTAGAIMAFAYNHAVPLIETNVRTVYLHHWFPKATDVTDQEILQLVETHLAVLPKHQCDAKTWYAALMDYGSHLKRVHGNPNSRAKNYAKQSTFRGSDREVRGAIIRTLTEKTYTRTALHKALSHLNEIKIDAQLERLVAEGMVVYAARRYQLPS